ncbi:hypothetical protein BH10ACI2_BH10ACI2_00080 [soil metagenome]
MNEQILQYELRPPGEPIEKICRLNLPIRAKVVKLHHFQGVPTIWVHCEYEISGFTDRYFTVYADGEKIEPIEGKRLVYVDTHFADGTAVHVFEIVDY